MRRSPSLLTSGHLSIKYFAPELSRFRPNLFYWIFIPADVVCLIFQAVGGALTVVSAGTSDIGIDMALVGLSLQVVVMVTFCAFFGDYLIRYFRSGSTHKFGNRCRVFFAFMGLAVLLILARCAYRLVELRDGYRGELIGDEPLFIALEGVYVLRDLPTLAPKDSMLTGTRMVIAAVCCLMIGHPGFGFMKAEKDASGALMRDSHELDQLPSGAERETETSTMSDRPLSGQRN